MRKRWSFRKYNAMLDWWKYNGPPTYIAAAGYMGLIKDRPKTKTPKEPLQFPLSPGPQKLVEAPKSKAGTGDLNELVSMFRNMGGGFRVN